MTTDTETTTYRLSHPDLSEPIEIDSDPRRTESAIRAWATTYILRQFDHMVPMAEWTVEVVR